MCIMSYPYICINFRNFGRAVYKSAILYKKYGTSKSTSLAPAVHCGWYPTLPLKVYGGVPLFWLCKALMIFCRNPNPSIFGIQVTILKWHFHQIFWFYKNQRNFKSVDFPLQTDFKLMLKRFWNPSELVIDEWSRTHILELVDKSSEVEKKLWI